MLPVRADGSDGVYVVNAIGQDYSGGVTGTTTYRATGRTTFHVHTHVREDALVLFGFANDADRATFRALIGVSNVGPKIAVAVLSALPASELARAHPGGAYELRPVAVLRANRSFE